MFAIIHKLIKNGGGRGKIALSIVTLVVFLLTLGCSKNLIPEPYKYLDYTGKINRHSKMIYAPSDTLFAMVTDIKVFNTLYPPGLVEVTETTQATFAIGTVRHILTKFNVKLHWDVEVIEVIDNEKIVLRFLDGIFRGGYEIWEFKEKENCTEVIHTILYNVNGFFYSMMWVIKKGAKKHDFLVEETLDRMRRKAETPIKTSLDGVTN